MVPNPGFFKRLQHWPTASWINYVIFWVILGAVAIGIGYAIDKTPKPLFGLGLFTMIMAIQSGRMASERKGERSWRWLSVVAGLLSASFYILHFSRP